MARVQIKLEESIACRLTVAVAKKQGGQIIISRETTDLNGRVADFAPDLIANEQIEHAGCCGCCC